MSIPTTLIIFGASGDLTQRKLMPSLFSLDCKGRLPEDFNIIGMARSEASDESFRADMKDAMQEFAPDDFTPDRWEGFAPMLSYVCGDFKAPEDLQSLQDRLDEIEEQGPGHRLYYLATPPFVYEQALERLGQAGMVEPSQGFRRVVIEKPFGHDLESAQELNSVAHKYLEEDQIYRIDHYLGKETVQNVLVFRFANSIFEPVWNRNYIDHVQITVAEQVGVGHRAEFYDGVGVLRDMFQNHLMQLLSLVAMEPPASFDATDIRNERVKVLNSIRPIEPEQVRNYSLLAQYEGYRQEEGVAKDSQTATYAALRLFIDNWRWQGIPFYLRSGKHLKAKSTEVHIQFRSVPHMMFPLDPGETIRPNALDLCIQPDEGIHLRFEAKVPDQSSRMDSVDMEFHYADAFGEDSIPDAYERLLLDALNGDQSLFTRADTIELAWRLIDSILAGWQGEDSPDLAEYRVGSWGPDQADVMIRTDGRHWSLGCFHD
ncbi:MAG: glucose-6-phosphate dehydrogenase [Anaerolineales bacterium]